MTGPRFYKAPNILNLFSKEYEHRHRRREALAKHIYEHWVQLMLEAGHGDEVYIWDNYHWDREMFIEAVSVWVGELVVEPLVQNMEDAAKKMRGGGL